MLLARGINLLLGLTRPQPPPLTPCPCPVIQMKWTKEMGTVFKNTMHESRVVHARTLLKGVASSQNRSNSL